MGKILRHYIVRIYRQGEAHIDVGVVTEPALNVRDGYFQLYELNEPHDHIGVSTAGVIRYQLIPVYESLGIIGC